jgi:hypothetical protein
LVLEGKSKGYKGEVIRLKLRDDTEILINRKPAKVSDLAANKRVRVLFEQQGKDLVAIRISVTSLGSLLSEVAAMAETERPEPLNNASSGNGGTVSGILQRVALTDREIVVVRPGPSSKSEIETTFLVPEDVKVTRAQHPIRFQELKEGEQVTIKGETRDGKQFARSIEVGR